MENAPEDVTACKNIADVSRNLSASLFALMDALPSQPDRH
jgi:hypothetical protein